MKKHIEEQEAQNNKNYIKQNNCTASFMWDVNGIITALELQAGCCMGVYAEDVQQIIDLVLKDNAITAQAV
jgi:predicted metalloprotease